MNFIVDLQISFAVKLQQVGTLFRRVTVTDRCRFSERGTGSSADGSAWGDDG